MNRIKQQPTCSVAFDNWQHSITKMWQGGEKASVFQRGTAFFIKQDKAFLLPVGTSIQSPHGVLFLVTSCVAETIYTCVITGDFLPSNFVLPESNNNSTTANSTRKRKKFYKLGLIDPFISGVNLLKKPIKKQRDKALQKEKRKYELIQLPVKYFKRQMKYETRISDNTIARQKTKSCKHHVPEYKLHCRAIMEQKRRNESICID